MWKLILTLLLAVGTGACATVLLPGCHHRRVWEEIPIEIFLDEREAEWEALHDLAGRDLPYWERDLYYGMPEAEVRSRMGPPTRESTDLTVFRRFRAPRTGKALLWTAGEVVVCALIDGKEGVLVELLVARRGTHRAYSDLHTRAQELGNNLEPGMSLTEVVRLLGSPDEVLITSETEGKGGLRGVLRDGELVWLEPDEDAGVEWPDLASKLVLIYYGLEEGQSRAYCFDPESYKLVSGPWDGSIHHWRGAREQGQVGEATTGQQGR